MQGSGYYVASLDDRGRRLRTRGLLARGNGKWTIDDVGLRFLRLLTKRPIDIPRDHIISVQLSATSWWGGKWLMGSRVVEVRWRDEGGHEVVSGFVFSGKPEENLKAAQELGARRPAV
ncbi:MAG: hypothetical protein ABFC80_03165 [Coriobacteriales bacterium]|nr:hypothetical protein [Actinomycetes bacterium]